MRCCEHKVKSDGSPVSTKEEIDTNANAFKDFKKNMNRNAEIGGIMCILE